MQVLIAVDSRYGATREIAEAIGHTLTDHGHAVEVRAAEEVPDDLGGPEAVIMGSGVYAGQWLRHARELLDRAADALSATPLWAFSSGPLSPDAALVPPPLMEERLAVFDPRDHVVFAGKLDHRQLLMGDKAVAQSLDADDGDYRDWDAVAAWAERVAAALEG